MKDYRNALKPETLSAITAGEFGSTQESGKQMLAVLFRLSFAKNLAKKVFHFTIMHFCVFIYGLKS